MRQCQRRQCRAHASPPAPRQPEQRQDRLREDDQREGHMCIHAQRVEDAQCHCRPPLPAAAHEIQAEPHAAASQRSQHGVHARFLGVIDAEAVQRNQSGRRQTRARIPRQPPAQGISESHAEDAEQGRKRAQGKLG